MFRLGLAVSTALSVLLPGRSVVGDIALAEPGDMNTTCINLTLANVFFSANIFLHFRLVTKLDKAKNKPAIFGALWSEDLLTLGKDVPRTPIRHFLKIFVLYKQKMRSLDIMVFKFTVYCKRDSEQQGHSSEFSLFARQTRLPAIIDI